MNIAIVEDMRSERDSLTQKIEHYMGDKQIPYTLFTYENAEDFVSALDTHTFDIVFMDIYMGKMTGMDAAILLRRKDRDCKLIFLTTSDEYLRQGYSVNATHYLIKPASEEDFAEAMAFCRIEPEYDVSYLDFVSSGAPVHLHTKQIMYVDLEKRTVCIHTPNQVIAATGTFRDLTESLMNDRRFLLCIKGVLVNMDYIASNRESAFILKNGEEIPVNVRNKKQILQTYRSYIFENMGGEL